MEQTLTKLLLSGYTLSAGVGLIHAHAGGPLWSALLIFWLGGAAAVLMLATLSAHLSPAEESAHPWLAEPDEAWIARERELIAWDEDLARETAEAVQAGITPRLWQRRG